MLLIEDEQNILTSAQAELLQRAASAALDAEGVVNACASLRVVDGGEIRRLNREMRQTDSVTDVLSFPELNYPEGTTLGAQPRLLRKSYDPSLGAYFLGDIALNIERAREQAAEYGHASERELAYLTVHAMLHLCGYDHMTDEDKTAMRAMEKRVMSALGLFKNGGKLMSNEDCIKLALDAREMSYSPYSRFRVGACLVSEDGRTFTGANFENASYGATICAERCAVSCAIAQGVRRYSKIYISCDEGYAWPCGICRQVLNEFKAGDMEIWVGSAKNEWKMKKLSELLPEGFGPEDLGK